MFCLAAGLSLTAPALRAQEVIVSELNELSQEAAFDQLPKTKGKFSPRYPSDMKKSGEVGYVITVAYVNEKGKRATFRLSGAHHLFVDAVETEAFQWNIRPGSLEGQPVGGLVWMSVIFNPTSSSPSKPNSTPRLLRVTPLILPAVEVNKKTDPEQWIVPLRLALESDGSVKKVMLPEQTQDRLRSVIEKSLPEWRFSPARQEGVPIASEVDLRVVVQPQLLPPGKKGVPPKMVKRVDPIYPREMMQTGMQGEVEVEITINKEGRVEHATVQSSNHPGFNAAALEAVQKWTFKPALVDGRAVETKARQKLMFVLPGSGSPSGAYDVEKRSWKKNTALPAEYQYDVAPKARGVVEPVYPYELLRDEVSGKVEMIFAIDAAGQVTQVKVIKAAHPALGLAMTAAIEAFAFDPALKSGRAVPSVLRMEHDFRRGENPKALAALQREKKRPETIIGMNALDQPLKPISQPSPKLPLTVESTGGGQAVIEFLVSEEGSVLLPRVVSASAPAFSYAAMQALSGWRFDPPRAQGKPAMVRVRIPFDFNLATQEPGPKAAKPPVEN